MTAAGRAKNKRTAPLVMVAMGLIMLFSSSMYGWVALDTANKLQTLSALEQNRYAAEICARLIDDQWNDLQAVLQQLELRSSLGADIRANDLQSVRREIQYGVDLVPALEFAAVYNRDGSLIFSYPPTNAAPRDATGTDWYRQLMEHPGVALGTTQRIKTQHGEERDLKAAASRIEAGGKTVGYLLTFYRFGDLDRWLTDLGLSDAMLYIVDRDGQIVDSSKSADKAIKFKGYPSFDLAMSRKSGSRTSTRWYNGQTTDIGFSYVKTPGWAVIIARSDLAAHAPARSLYVRLTVLGVLAVTVLAIGTILLILQYRTQNQLAVALAEQNEVLTQSERLKSDFLANVSHDLRTPLAALQLSISSMLDPDVNWEPDIVRENLRMAADGLDQIGSRVRNLLEMSRLEAHVYKMNMEVSDLIDIAGSAMEQMRSIIGNRHLELVFPDTPLLVDCDPVQIETVIVNLLENALKYSLPDTPIVLQGSEYPQAHEARFEIRNIGSKLSETDLARVFEKFYRAPVAMSIGGTGLGLAICKSIVESHGGAIGVANWDAPDSQTGGVVFWFVLPMFSTGADKPE
jgi:signal transduction histidine kinase